MNGEHVGDESPTKAVPPATVTLEPEARSVLEARRKARELLAAWDAEAFEWVVSQLVSELATNAVLHAGTTFRVTLMLHDGRVRCEVSDGSVRRPRLRHYTRDAATGRGLRLVDRLSTDWGVIPGPAGKTVWFELDADAEGEAPEPDLDAFLDAADLHVPGGRPPGGRDAGRRTRAASRVACAA